MPVEERFESTLALEWPVEGLEPLSFVLSRVFDQLCARLERAGVGAAVIHVRLKLVTREIHTRTLQLPTPLRDPRVLRTLVLLDLESHPPSAGIDQVTVVVDPVPARTQQFSLLERARPSPEKVSTLVARLTALAGEGRCGSPALVDSHDTAGFEMRSFGNNRTRSVQDRRGADRVRETPVDGNWRQDTSVCSQESGARRQSAFARLRRRRVGAAVFFSHLRAGSRGGRRCAPCSGGFACRSRRVCECSTATRFGSWRHGCLVVRSCTGPAPGGPRDSGGPMRQGCR